MPDGVMRSVLEGTLKFLYLLESPSTFTARCIEYNDALPAIAMVKWHDKAVAAIKAHSDPSEPELRPYRDLLLEDHVVANLRATFPRQMRREIKARWGFTELLKAVSRDGGALGPSGPVFLHTYSVASHLHHMTHEGTDMPFERDKRSAQRRNAIHVAHAARLVSDCFYYSLFRLGALYRFFKNPRLVGPEMMERHKDLLHELSQAEVNWRGVEYGPEDQTSAA